MKKASKWIDKILGDEKNQLEYFKAQFKAIP